VRSSQPPSWQINSSLFPTLSREGDRPTFRPRRPF
jgi:hypothetical protein